MYVSIPGLVCAAAMLAVGLAQWAFLKRVFANARAGLAGAALAEREAMHAKVLKVLLGVDVLVLPVAGYAVGHMVFGK
jgi:hypothetical protein